MWLRCKFYDYWAECKVYTILLTACMLIGLVLGAIGGNSIVGVVLIDDVKERSLNWFFARAGGTTSFLLSGIFDTVVLFAIILIVNINIYFLPANYFVSVYKGYLLGYNSLVVIRLFGISGATSIIFVYLPQQIVQLVCFIAVSAWANLRCYTYRTAGLFCITGVEYPLLFRRILHWMLVALIFSIVFSFVFGSLANTAIL